MKMTKAYRKYRRESGMAAFERECRTTTNTTGREAKAYKVPGTREYGEHNMYRRRWEDTKQPGEKAYE